MKEKSNKIYEVTGLDITNIEHRYLNDETKEAIGKYAIIPLAVLFILAIIFFNQTSYFIIATMFLVATLMLFSIMLFNPTYIYTVDINYEIGGLKKGARDIRLSISGARLIFTKESEELIKEAQKYISHLEHNYILKSENNIHGEELQVSVNKILNTIDTENTPEEDSPDSDIYF